MWILRANNISKKTKLIIYKTIIRPVLWQRTLENEPKRERNAGDLGKESTQEDIRWIEGRGSVGEEDRQRTDVDVRRALNNDSNKDTKTVLIGTCTKAP